HAAGLGRIGAQPDPDRYSKRFHHCDVLVVGAGPTGRATAEALAAGGADVTVIESDQIESAAPFNVQLLAHTTAVGYYEDNFVVAVERREGRQRLWKIRAAQVILATGATE